MSNFTYSTHNPNYSTPDAIYKELNNKYHFNFDPCPLNPNPTINGLEMERGTSTFVNPPYTGITAWIKKAISESEKGKLVVMLLRGDTSTKWFHELIIPNAEDIIFIKGRIRFKNNHNAPFPSIIVIFKKSLDNI